MAMVIHKGEQELRIDYPAFDMQQIQIGEKHSFKNNEQELKGIVERIVSVDVDNHIYLWDENIVSIS